ncbi:hypothetical protein SAMN04487993_10732 [Salipiger marinus]|uniref:Uncharacterized protein n=2 Tax=Salipiger marinus TaxID=555512 RepID=A0A1G8V768_9RHOB|nr:hypothetical protein SAMN04487993_10732 [Salipiger marinus]
MVIWTIRANRPAREIDRAVLAYFHEHFATRPERRMPPVVVVVTGIDQILRGWPYAENLLSDEAMGLVADVVAAVAVDIGDNGARPVPVALVEPEWNTGTLRDRVQAHLGEALMAQRNRLRVENRASLRQEAARTGRGLRHGLSLIGSRMSPKQKTDDQGDAT